MCSVLTVSAQEVSIRVTDNLGQTLPGVYVAVNNKVCAATDSVGLCSIVRATLSQGDSISVSMLGYGRAAQLFDGKAQYAFSLGEIPTYTIEEVKVKKSILAFYANNVNSYCPMNGIATADFVVRIRRRGEDSTHTVRGKLDFENKVSGKGMKGFDFGLFHLNNHLETDVDTAQFKQFGSFLRYVVGQGFWGVYDLTCYPSFKYRMEHHQAKLNYLKRRGDSMLFLVTLNWWSPLEQGKLTPRQSLLHIDIKEQETYESETSYVFTDPKTKNQHTDHNHIKYLLNPKKEKKMHNRHLPYYIAHQLSNETYEQWDIVLNNITFTPKK